MHWLPNQWFDFCTDDADITKELDTRFVRKVPMMSMMAFHVIM